MNPKFDGYKLAALSEADVVHALLLPADGLSQATVAAGAYLSFQEVQNRIRHNHLSPGIGSQGSATLGYIDKAGIFTIIEIDRSTLTVRFRSVFEIPQVIRSSQRGSEYPVAICAAPDIWVISDGGGQLFVVRTPQTADQAELLAQHDYIVDNEPKPCRMHAACMRNESILIIVSSRGQVEKAASGRPSLTFHLATLRILIPDGPPMDTRSSPVEILWTKRSTDIPSYVSSIADNWLICAGSTFEDVLDPIVVPMEDVPMVTLPDTQPTGKPPPPYSWTQTNDSLTIAIPLPSTTPKSHIHVSIAPKYLSVLIKDAEDSPFPIPRYAMKELWDHIDKETSLWTWDKQGERTVGLLTLHLEKKNEGTKWPHVFAHDGTNPDSEEVPETVDPSEMWKIREALEKYTSDLQGNGEFGTEMPSLAAGELDPSVDTEVGRRMTVSYFDVLTGQEASPHSAYEEILAFPIPSTISTLSSETDARSMVIKRGIDGLLFEGPVVPTVEPWEHTTTFPALGFVLASKRDLRYAFHLGKAAIVALESGGKDVNPNMYIYYAAKGAPNARQSVVRLGRDGSAGSLVGVALVDRKSVV